jgi:hypothetical protein
MQTFEVDPVTAVPAKAASTSLDLYLLANLGPTKIRSGSVEAYAFSAPGTLRKPDRNSFLETCLVAYDAHVPLVLSPDEVWVAVLQAVSKHIELFPEDARKAIVNFDGKKLLEIYANDFVKGSPDNDWPRVFNEFGGKIEEFLGKKRSLFDPTFSTTTLVTKTVIQVQMMSALSSYFDYKVYTRCGLPTVTLLGTVDDWAAISERVAALGEFYPKWAHQPLLDVTEQFAAAADGRVDLAFWQRFVKGHDGSGGYSVSGEVNAFFPYLDGKPNRALTSPRLSNGDRCGANLGAFPGSVSSVPVLWDYHGTEIKMRLATGIFGTAVDTSAHASGGVRPVVGWVLGEENPKS